MTDIKKVAGIWLPATEEHLLPFLEGAAKQNSKGEGSYQLHTLVAMLNHTPSNRRSLVLDVGGNVGMWSMHFARAFDRVVAYEPIEINQRCFMLNTIEHPEKPTSNVELRRVALGNTIGEVVMEYRPDVTAGTHVASQDAAKRETSSINYTVPLTTLDAENHPFVSAIKMDVEGYEYPIVLGAEGTIRRCKPIICIEQKPWDIFEWKQYAALDLLLSWGAKVKQRVTDDFILGWD